MPRKSKPMGRPTLGVQATQVRLTEAQREQIRELVGDRGMAQYIRDAVDEKLAREPKQKR